MKFVRSVQSKVPDHFILEMEAQSVLHQEALLRLEELADNPVEARMALGNPVQTQTRPIRPVILEGQVARSKEQATTRLALPVMIKEDDEIDAAGRNRGRDSCGRSVKHVSLNATKHQLQLGVAPNQNIIIDENEKESRRKLAIELNIHDALFFGDVPARRCDMSDQRPAGAGQEPHVESIPVPRRLIQYPVQDEKLLVPPAVEGPRCSGILPKDDDIEKVDRDSERRPVKIDIPELSGQKIHWSPSFPCKLVVPDWF
jgi:hypothetical protein